VVPLKLCFFVMRLSDFDFNGRYMFVSFHSLVFLAYAFHSGNPEKTYSAKDVSLACP
jgi:hypothetical protein